MNNLQINGTSGVNGVVVIKHARINGYINTNVSLGPNMEAINPQKTWNNIFKSLRLLSVDC